MTGYHRAMRSAVLFGLAACSFRHGVDPVISDTALADTAVVHDSPHAVCGNGVVEPGEACEPGQVTSCSTSCGDTGTRACNASCAFDDCVITVDPATAWQGSIDGVTWTSAALPSTNWGCTSCSRLFRTTVCDMPTSVEFQWASDNKARMSIGGTYAFTDYWLPNYCTDAVCCTKCCDTTANCLASTSGTRTLRPDTLSLFHAGANELRWEVFQESGGSGFYTTMTLRYHSP